jgi:hypothetical protein
MQKRRDFLGGLKMKTLVFSISFLVILAASNIAIAVPGITILSESYHVYGSWSSSWGEWGSYDRTESYPIGGSGRVFVEASGYGDGVYNPIIGKWDWVAHSDGHAEVTYLFQSTEDCLNITSSSYSTNHAFTSSYFSLTDITDSVLIDKQYNPNGSFAYDISPSHVYEFALSAFAWGLAEAYTGLTYAEVRVEGIPEPATVLLFGLGGLALLRKRRA